MKSSFDGEVFFNNVEINVNRGDKIAVIGRDSRAITAFFEIIMGEKEAETGTFEFGQTITTAYLPNDNAEFFETDLNLIDWLRQYAEGEDVDEVYVRGFLGKMLFTGEESFKKASVLSGGEKVRCMLSRMMLQQANFLVLDEPTNHLDLESIQALNNSLQNFPGTLMFTSHDHTFTQTVANRIIEVTPKGIIDKLMTYDEYIASDKVAAQREEMYA